MIKYVVKGGKRLYGTTRVQGAKNSVLPILAATIISGRQSVIINCPKIVDVHMAVEILKFLGCEVYWQGNDLVIDSAHIENTHIPNSLMTKMRSSVIFLGAILARMNKATCSTPGGCEIGARPVNLHLKAFRQVGVTVTEKNGYIHCDATGIKSGKIHLDFPSVGATENMILAAVNCPGKTIITNAAREPEIVDLQDFLNAMGAKVTGAGSDKIVIEGVKTFVPVSWEIIPDRIVAATVLFAVAGTGGDVTLQNVNIHDIDSILAVLEEMGTQIMAGKDSVRICSEEKLNAIDSVKTMPFPGFPTDAQPQMMAALTHANGSSIIEERIFENRFKTAGQLVKMGANITLKDQIAVIRGVDKLTGCRVDAPDLRGGAALVIAGLMANGTTEIGNIHFVERGYDGIEKIFASLGGDIEKVEYLEK